MAKVFITGSSDGLGLVSARILAELGHRVVLHARNEARALDAKNALPEADAVVVGDVSTIAAMRSVAEQANQFGRFDAVIHNVGVGYGGPRVETDDGLSRLWAVNVLAPYVLTALMHKPERLVYLSSGMHTSGAPDLDDLQWKRLRWSGSQAYSDSKLHDVLLTLGVARRWPDVLSNSVDPGWAPTRMGGPGAPDDLSESGLTQAWLAVSDDPAARTTGGYFYRKRRRGAHASATSLELQDRLLDRCCVLSGIALA
jgi:NAD(P)-dependent dehydrogenase (short-subunit alcohol dehydrogenase family)